MKILMFSIMVALPAHAETLVFIEHAITDATSLHAGPAHDNVGDILTFANPIFDAADARQVGTDQGYCVRLVPGRAYECHWTLLAPRGQIVVEGPFYDAADSTLAVIGGTGAYGGARGQMKLHARNAAGGAFDFTYELK